MPLQDVSNDQTMISWLRQSGHGHLIDQNRQNIPLTAPSPIPNTNLFQQPISSSNYPSQPSSLSPIPPLFNNIPHANDPLSNVLHQSSHIGIPSNSPSPPPIPQLSHLYNQQSSPINLISSPTQFLGSHTNHGQVDLDIENLKRDPNTRVLQRPPQDDVVYKQRVFVRYLQPPTPPVGGTIIVREKQPAGPPPDPPIVIKRAPPPPATPPPVIIRERPPPMPAPEGTTVIDKLIPPGPKPPRQVVIEQYPPLPPKPQDVIIERWLPMPPRQRKILYERLPPTIPQQPKPIIVQYGQPNVRVQREIITAPGAQLSHPQITGHTDINQILNNIVSNQNIQPTSVLSSLVGYSPYTSIQPNYGIHGQNQPNIVILQNGQPATISSSSLGVPLSCVCAPNQNLGLGAYGSGVSTIPMTGQSIGQSTVYNVPDNVPIDNILRQLGIDPNSLQRSTGYPPIDPHNAVSHVWNAASHSNSSNLLNPTSAVQHVWNSASHSNLPSPFNPQSAVQHVWHSASHSNLSNPNSSSAVQHVWNAAAHGPSNNLSHSSSAGNVWDRIEHYLHPQSNNPPQSSWNQQPPPNYPPPPSNYPPPPSNYPPPQSNYPPPQSNYPPPQSNYPPPSSSSYPPVTGSSSSGGGSGVLARLFGGGGGS